MCFHEVLLYRVPTITGYDLLKTLFREDPRAHVATHCALNMSSVDRLFDNIENDNRGYQPFRLFTNKIVYHTPVSAANDNEPIDYNYACNQNQYLQEHLQQHQPHQQHQLAVPTQ